MALAEDVAEASLDGAGASPEVSVLAAAVSELALLSSPLAGTVPEADADSADGVVLSAAVPASAVVLLASSAGDEVDSGASPSVAGEDAAEAEEVVESSEAAELSCWFSVSSED